MNKRSTKKIIYIVAPIFALILLLIFVFSRIEKNDIYDTTPELVIETPQKISLSETDEFTLDVLISYFGEALYPAASMNIAFDPSHLEFLGVGEGNVFVTNIGDISRVLPEWSYNPDSCNKSGVIKIMYLDITAGKNAFSKDLLEEEDNVVVRLKFRLRGSARVGDVYDLVFEDAVFAASDESESLAMTTNTLKVRDGKIVIGE